MGFWRMEKAMQKFPDYANRSTAAQLSAVFMGSALYAVVTEGAANFDVHQLQLWLSDPMILASLFWTGCITTALTVYMETIALKTLSAAETTLIFSTEPWGCWLRGHCAFSNVFCWTYDRFCDTQDITMLSISTCWMKFDDSPLLQLEINEDDETSAASTATGKPAQNRCSVLG
jgi:hypothetical protein